MRIPLEYGDNFPVPTGGWNPAVPWRFPKHEVLPGRPGWLSRVLPWITLGLGMTLGILWMSWRMELPAAAPSPAGTAVGEKGVVYPETGRAVPVGRPVRLRSRLA